MRTIELHILQNFPPSNLNRDDSGAPKDCDFGGYRRQRISSQCLKRSVRQSAIFQTQMTDRLGIRTKRAPEAVTKRLVELGHSEPRAKSMALEFFDTLYGTKDEKTDYLLYIGSEELQRATDLLHTEVEKVGSVADELAQLRKESSTDNKKEKDTRTKAIADKQKPFVELSERYKKMYPKHVRSVDVALFGRMLADNPVENIDAACQVSHALSVNRMHMEFDYFTAVDDLQPEENTGAGMIGTVGFSSSCFYRFACIDTDQLIGNLGGDASAAKEGILAFAESFIQARPSGKQNTFAAHSLPGFILFVVRDSGQPVSLANAFEKPVSPSEKESLTEKAILSLSKHYAQLKKMYGLNGKAFCVSLEDVPSAVPTFSEAGVETVQDVPTLLKKLEAHLTA